MSTRHEIVSSYRSLMAAGLRAVKYASPDRYVLRDRLRAGFRDGCVGDHNSQKIGRTVEFLNAAAKWRGLEHRVVKNLCRVWFTRAFPSKKTYEERQRAEIAYKRFDSLVQKMSESMGLCIK